MTFEELAERVAATLGQLLDPSTSGAAAKRAAQALELLAEASALWLTEAEAEQLASLVALVASRRRGFDCLPSSSTPSTVHFWLDWYHSQS